MQKARDIFDKKVPDNRGRHEDQYQNKRIHNM